MKNKQDMSRKWCSISSRVIPFLIAMVAVLSLSMKAYANNWSYSVKPGDTLWSICETYAKEKNCWLKLGPLNNIDSTRRIPPGTRIDIPVSWLKVPAATAQIENVVGAVYVTSPDQSKVSASNDTELSIGEEVSTQQGFVTIRFADGSTIQLEPYSSMIMDTLSNFELNGMVDSSLRLNRGAIKTRVIPRTPRSQFRTITPSAVASVRGTEYRISVTSTLNELEPSQSNENKSLEDEASEKMVLAVYEGLVDVGAQKQTVSVPKNFGLVTKKGEAPSKPVQLLPAPSFVVEAIQHESYLDEQGLQRDPVQVSWNQLEGADSYSLNVLRRNKDMQESLLRAHQTKGQNLDINGLLPGCYTLSLRGVDRLSLQGFATTSSMCIVAKLEQPVFLLSEIQPAKNSSLQLAWKTVPLAQHYQVEISEEADFSSSTKIKTVKGNSIILQAEDKPFYVRVIAIGKDDTSSQASQTFEWIPEEDKSYWQALIPVGIFLLGFL